MFRAAKHLFRLFRIAQVLARYDALFLLDRLRAARWVIRAAKLISRRNVPGRPGERLAQALAELGPTFIKLGQALSTRADLVGAQVAEDLSNLRDRVSPFDFDTARRTVEEELDRPIEDLFSEFAESPIAAASIAQVHFATTADGREVAVKILRPGIEAAFRRDLDLLYWLAELAEFTQPQVRRLKPVEMVETFERSMDMEMDLRFEAAAASEIAENFAGDEDFRVPDVDWRRTARRVMTTERISGIKADRRAEIIDAGLDPMDVTEKAANAFFKMVFRDGFFHGDMHPGNLFVDEKGVLLAVDFGIMGRVDRTTQHYLGKMLMGFLSGDYRMVADVHFEAGYVGADQSREAFTQAARSIAEPILDRPLAEISIAKLLAQLFHVTEAFGMEAQPQLLLLQKTMLTAEGIGRSLVPDMNMWELARPMIEDWMKGEFGPQARVRAGLQTTLETAERLPRILDYAERAAARFADGTITVESRERGGLQIEAPRRADLNPQLLLPWALVAVLLFVLLLD